MTDEDVAIQLTKHEQEIGSLKHRMSDVERLNKTIQSISASTEKLAYNMESMLEEQKSMRERLDALEKIPSIRYNEIRKITVTAIISSIAGGAAVVLFRLMASYL